MSNLIERTALAPFELDGRPIGKGQIVPLTTIQLERAVQAGVVYRDDSMNAAVPRQDLPPTQGSAEPKGPDGLDDTTVDDLKALAKAETIDLGEATKKADIIAAIRAGRQAKASA